jgi:hypothetical protein
MSKLNYIQILSLTGLFNQIADPRLEVSNTNDFQSLLNDAEKPRDKVLLICRKSGTDFAKVPQTHGGIHGSLWVYNSDYLKGLNNYDVVTYFDTKKVKTGKEIVEKESYFGLALVTIKKQSNILVNYTGEPPKAVTVINLDTLEPVEIPGVEVESEIAGKGEGISLGGFLPPDGTETELTPFEESVIEEVSKEDPDPDKGIESLPKDFKVDTTTKTRKKALESPSVKARGLDKSIDVKVNN